MNLPNKFTIRVSEFMLDVIANKLKSPSNRKLSTYFNESKPEFDSEERLIGIELLKRYEIISETLVSVKAPYMVYRVTSIGYQALEIGGVEIYLNKLMEAEKKKEELANLQMQELKSDLKVEVQKAQKEYYQKATTKLEAELSEKTKTIQAKLLKEQSDFLEQLETEILFK